MGPGPKHVALQADLFLRIKLAKKHADLADLRIDVFYHRGFIRIPAFERQKFQAVIHNRSNASAPVLTSFSAFLSLTPPSISITAFDPDLAIISFNSLIFL